ncbi:MAG: iron chelate uptake ABC transporter family permease subunit [Planctomycetota bacterium]|nr:iron chelate uptake ABC transporter family permease subunit [Planctomycetota bacterium]
MKRSVVLILTSICLFAAGATGNSNSELPHQRIVSFSPALTKIVFEMGLGDYVVGVTRLCRLPEGVSRPRLGDAFTINTEVVLSVRPDVILTQTAAEKFQAVRDINPSVRIESFQLETLSDISTAVERIGRITGRSDLAKRQSAAFSAKLESVRRRVADMPRPRVIFVMGTDRPTVAGADNFIADLIDVSGGVNAGAYVPGQTRWRRTHIDAIARAKPDVIVCQVFDTAQAENARQYWLGWKDLPAAAAGRVYVVTDPCWSIPSTHLADLASDLAYILRQDVTSVSQPEMSLWLAWLHRLLAAAIVGAALAVGGAALQGLLRNPLAEPYILGVSSGAGVGVLLGMAASAWYAIPGWASTPVLAFAGAMITCAAVYAIAQRQGRLDPYSLILSGVIINTFNAAIMLTIYLYVDPHRIADFAHWAMGRLPDSIDVLSLSVCGALTLTGWIVLLINGSAFNVLGLGEAVAGSSGVAVNRLRIVTFLCVGLMTAAAVSLAGPIGFLGLIIPHLCRMVLGPEHRRLFITSGLAGAVFLMAAEILCRYAGPWIGVSLIPVGIITALSGGPFFIFLLRRRFQAEST